MAIIASADQDPETGQRRPRGGGKLSRSETVTVRLDPKLNYLCELAARAQRRTKSSFIEWAIAEAMGLVELPETDFGSTPTIKDRKEALWEVDEPDRLVALAFIAPALLTHEEQLIWRTVREYGYLWRGSWVRDSSDTERWAWNLDRERLVIDRLRETWETIKQVASGQRSIAALPSYEKVRSKKAGGFPDDLDDDVPF